MKRSAMIRKNYARIREAMVGSYRDVIEADGRVQYDIYIWEDGEIRRLEEPQGSNTELVPNEYESRELFFVTTIELPFFDPFDYSDEGAPEDEAEREQAAKEICDWLVEEYDNEGVDEALETVIRDAKLEESYGLR